MSIPDLIFPDGLTPELFLRDYWQRRPLLMRQALPGFDSPLDPDELAGLACEEGVEARIVLERDGVRPWEARHGPFDDEAFARLPETHWTLLVQDVDKHVPEVAELLGPFGFLPDWRVDDVMISYAPDQGSVGPHIDDYDVFLVQARGRRRWRIHTQAVAEDDFIPGLDLRILPRFEAEEDWVLEPGDILYLPPNVAHWGVAEGDCMTYSVGLRAPELRDLARAWLERLVERHVPPGRYRDPPLTPARARGEIDPAALGRIGAALAALQGPQSGEFIPWLGAYLTETKHNLHPEPAEESISPRELRTLWAGEGLLLRSGYARLAFCRGPDGGAWLFANGEAHGLSSGKEDLLVTLTQDRELPHDRFAPWLKDPEALDLLCRLYNAGLIEPADA